MFYATNIILILLVALIAYWWANQGLLSALLHLVCVIVAGLVALAFWEPLTYGVLIRGTVFDDFAPGIVLVLLFAITLFVLRQVADRMAPANVKVPQWASLAFGGTMGACAGVLTLGIFLIGAGHIQSANKLFGFRGYARSQSGDLKTISGLWLPVHKWTDDFYSLLSVTSMKSARPLRQYSPRLYQQASLLRDSYEGHGKLSLKPSDASVESLQRYVAGNRTSMYVRIKFGLGAVDFGEQLTLSKSQVRLIGEATGSRRPDVVHPVGWLQHSGYHLFDNVTHYATSKAGSESAELTFDFDVPSDFSPKFIQVRGTRYLLPRLQEAPRPIANLDLMAGGTNNVDPATLGGRDITSAVAISNSVRPLMISTNTMPGTIKERDRYLTDGKATFPRRGAIGSSKLRIQGIYEPEGTRCVRVNISRGSPADLYAFLDARTADETSEIALVDFRGGTYSPIGYFYQHPDGVTIRLDPVTRIRTIEEDMVLPSSGDHTMELLFYLPLGERISGLRFGDNGVGSCSIEVTTAGQR